MTTKEKVISYLFTAYYCNVEAHTAWEDRWEDNDRKYDANFFYEMKAICISKALNILNHNPYMGIKYVNKSSEKCCYFEVDGFQISFHNPHGTMKDIGHEELSFDGKGGFYFVSALKRRYNTKPMLSNEQTTLVWGNLERAKEKSIQPNSKKFFG